jgi:tetratricopeptide (TPR) repeat protein
MGAAIISRLFNEEPCCIWLAFTDVVILRPHTTNRPLQYLLNFAAPKMKPLDVPDTHHLSAAQGWLELGNAGEALRELDRITSECQEHPDVLETRWAIEAKQLNWEECVRLATLLTHRAPGRSSGWIHRSFALHELKRSQKAFELLLPALTLFQDIWVIPYNLACYQCQLNNLKSAMEYYKQALIMGGEPIRDMALEDADLKSLRAKIADA